MHEPRSEKTGFLHMRKQSHRSIVRNRTTDQRLCFRYLESTFPLFFSIGNFKPLAISSNCAARFVSDLVGTPEDRLSQNEARISHFKKRVFFLFFFFFVFFSCTHVHIQQRCFRKKFNRKPP